MSCANCLSRRAFLAKGAAAAAAAALVAGCGNGVFGPPLPSHSAGGVPSGTLTIKVSDHTELASVGTLVQFGERAVKRVDTMSFFALSLICTHQGCDTAVQPTNIIECPCHHSRFNPDGTVINGPDNSAPTSINPLATIPTSYNPQTDELTIG
ncbi:MAG TPA: Rieske 2Fe-2S domain-containing protein [Gemmatimonadaceae bacterium]|jgi:Rieske Fe-S protein